MSKLPHIVRERMRASQPETHPDADLLAAFAERALPDRERLPLLEHLSICSTCRDVLALAAVPAKSPAFTTKDTTDARKAPWFTSSVLRWGTAAACVVVVGTAVLLNYSERAASPKQLEAPAQYVPASPAAPAPQPPAVSTQREEDLATRAALPKADISDELKKQMIPRRDASAQKDARASQAYGYISSGQGTGMAGKQLANEWHGSRSNGAAVAGDVAMGGPVLLPPLPEPAKPLQTPSNKEMQNLPMNGRAYGQYARLSSGPVASIEVQSPSQQAQAQSPQVQAQLVDAPASSDSDKKVEILGRAKAPSSSSTSNALAVAPSDQLDHLQTYSAPTPETTAKAKRRVFSHSESTRWNLSSDGQLQRSIDSGKTWQPVAAPPGAAFRALSYNGPDIWVGGAAGLLYNSPDAGTRWDLVKPSANGSSLSADIAAIAFTDPQHGKITTSNGEIWTTADGGQSWNESH
jgi:photosynthesis system II assembly factor YCF48-like protein